MRQDLTLEQRQRIESLVRERDERCGLCGNADLRCGEDAASYLGGGYSVQLRCTNTGAEAHARGTGLVRDYPLNSDEARLVGLG